MTTIDTEKLALGWGKIAEGAMEISLAYSAIEPPVARAGVSDAGGVAPSSTPAPTEPPPLKPQVDAGLSICPIHGIPWVVKAAGVSKAGKKYNAFWKCNQRDGDTFCDEKPQRIWVDLHPPVEGSVAA